MDLSWCNFEAQFPSCEKLFQLTCRAQWRTCLQTTELAILVIRCILSREARRAGDTVRYPLAARIGRWRQILHASLILPPANLFNVDSGNFVGLIFHRKRAMSENFISLYPLCQFRCGETFSIPCIRYKFFLARLCAQRFMRFEELFLLQPTIVVSFSRAVC